MNVAEEIFRFAELAARTCLEPDLARRFDADPQSVLREFGLSAAEAQRATAEVRAVESLSGAGADPAGARWCVCWAPELPLPGVSE